MFISHRTGVLHENPALNNPATSPENEEPAEIKMSPVKLRNKSKRIAEVSERIFHFKRTYKREKVNLNLLSL